MRPLPPRRRIATLVPIFIAVWIAVFTANRQRGERAPAPAAPPPAVATAPAAPRATQDAGWGADVGFRSHERLAEHFQKHGREVGAANEADYLRMAQALRDAAAGGNVEELKRDDGVTCRFDRASGCFLAFNDDGTIRTFFRPRDGQRYFERQADRPARAP
ncbi:MAG: hypothetical protein HZA61_00765 [Candidatus Eisenbacteria bacterium]|uniref:Uncharacterized protein n=1 Tax=Eiseniibacteriota bacterium TaxID=2212470 RepID=A0A933W0I7_UNCEI|nr:hypothetical protein [Candidatus Eisenbacteria bacterium]